MTFPSRRKRPITRLSLPTGSDEGRESRVEGGRRSKVEGRGPKGAPALVGGHSICDLRFGICDLRSLVLPVAIVVALALPVRAENAKLQWGKEHSTASKATTQSTSLKFVKPNVVNAATADADVATNAAASGASISNVRNTDFGASRGGTRNSINTSANTSADSSGIIRLVAYETNDAPRLTSGRETEPETRSVVVNRDGEATDGFREAQLPPVNTGKNVKDPSGASKPGAADGLRSPFTDSPAEPPQPNPLPIPENNTAPALPAPENGGAAAQPNNSQPQQSQPPASQPGTGQFQPVLPNGPEQTPTPTPEVPSSEAAIKAEGAKAQESCEKSVQNLKAYTVDKVNLNIAITGTEGKDFPFECSIDDGSMHAGRCWEQVTYMWKASAMCHKPLYFEDEQLERYGHSFTPCLQPFVSGAHFFTRLPVLPYCMGVEPPQECIYALGYYRPGSCAPYMINPIPLSVRGGLFEAGAVVGTAAVLP